MRWLAQLLLLVAPSIAGNGAPAVAAAPVVLPGETDDEAPMFSAPVLSTATGSYFVNVSAHTFQSDKCRGAEHGADYAGLSTQLEILLPSSTAEATTLVLALPVGDCGTSTKEYGSAIALIRKNKWLDAHPGFAVATMAFSTTPWFADRPANGSAAPVLQESYVLKVVLPYLLNRLAVNGKRPIASTANVSLVGFSKSGWGSFSLLARNPHVFSKAAMWDSPAMLSAAYCKWLNSSDQWNMMEVFGDCDNWSAHSPIEIVRRGGAAALNNRLWLAGQHYFGPMCGTRGNMSGPPGTPFSHTVDFHAELTKQSVLHVYNDKLDPGKHEWAWLWLEPALTFLALKSDDHEVAPVGPPLPTMSAPLSLFVDHFPAAASAIVAAAGPRYATPGGAQGMGTLKSDDDDMLTVAADLRCELNGRWSDGRCQCQPPWQGTSCGALRLEPANRLAGYHPTTGNGPAQEVTSSWGAATLHINGTWHSYVSEITLGCGMAAWTSNSRIVHAVSNNPLTEPLVRRDEAAPVFATEPVVARAPNGSVVLWFTAKEWPSSRSLCTACSGGETTPASRAPNGSCAGAGSMDATMMMHAASPYGPWLPPVRVLSGRPGSYVPGYGGDTNLAMVLLSNGSALGMMRVLGMADPGTWASIPHLVTASNWAVPASYRVHTNRLLPQLRGSGLEDMFLWHSSATGSFHALFHDMQDGEFSAAAVTHGWSEDGLSWAVGTAGAVANHTVTYTDNLTDTLGARERPQLIFGASGEVLALATSACPHGNRWQHANESDFSFTLLQPVFSIKSDDAVGSDRTAGQTAVLRLIKDVAVLPSSSMPAGVIATALAAGLAPLPHTRTVYSLDFGWRFQLETDGTQQPVVAEFPQQLAAGGARAPPPACNGSNASFPVDLGKFGKCGGLQSGGKGLPSAAACAERCCGVAGCRVWNWCLDGGCADGHPGDCWVDAGKIDPETCHDQGAPGWVARARGMQPRPPPGPPSPPHPPPSPPHPQPPPPPSPAPPGPPNGPCDVPQCQLATVDSGWRQVNVPHDFMVEGTFNAANDISQGFLPFGSAWYRKELSLPPSAKGQPKWLDFEGVMVSSQVWLNGHFLGNHTSGYTPFRYFLRDAVFNWGGKNVLAVRADASKAADAEQIAWYYDGAGIYRHVKLTVAPLVHIAPWGVYAPALVTAATISHAADGSSTADAVLNCSVDLANNGAAAATSVHITATVIDASGATVGTSQSAALTVPTSASGSSKSDPWTVVMPPIRMPKAALWSVDNPLLYTLITTVTGGDAVNTTFGVRRVRFDSDRGFLLNELPVKIKGACNHQDFAGVGVAVPDALQDFRVSKMKSTGINGWRTAHNPPTPVGLTVVRFGVRISMSHVIILSHICCAAGLTRCM